MESRKVVLAFESVDKMICTGANFECIYYTKTRSCNGKSRLFEV